MARKTVPQEDLVIPISTQPSNAVDIDKFSMCRGFSIQSPAAVSGTITIEGSMDGGSNFAAIQSGGVDITIAAGKIIVIDFMAWDKLRVISNNGGGEAAERTFKFRGLREY